MWISPDLGNLTFYPKEQIPVSVCMVLMRDKLNKLKIKHEDIILNVIYFFSLIFYCKLLRVIRTIFLTIKKKERKEKRKKKRNAQLNNSSISHFVDFN